MSQVGAPRGSPRRRPPRRRGPGGSDALIRSRSRSSQAARGSPSRGWPTLPGSAATRRARGRACSPSSRRSPLAGWPSGRTEGERDVGVADHADAVALHVQAQLGQQVGEARTPRRGRAGMRGRARSTPPRRSGLRVARNARFSGARSRRASIAAAMRAPFENSSRASSPVTARSWLPARHTATCSRASSTQASGSAP